jgi:hypothetical protein
MPLTSPAYPPGPYRFINREYLIITYRTDPEKLRALVPEPLLPDGDTVKYEFIRMPDSTGFGDYTETGQVIPVSFRVGKGGYSHCMFLNDEGPIAGGRELWGFPKKLANPTLRTEIDTLVGTLDYGPVRVATGTMGYKHRQADLNKNAAQAVADEISGAGGTAIAVGMDVTDEAQVQSAVTDVVARYVGVDVLVSNAGIQIVHPVESFPLPTGRRCWPFILTAPSSSGGSIIYMGSVHSKESSRLRFPAGFAEVRSTGSLPTWSESANCAQTDKVCR